MTSLKHQLKSAVYMPRYYGASLVAQTVKNLPAMQETQVRSLGPEDPLEKGMATHSSILAWRIPWTEKCGGRQSIGISKTQTQLSDERYTFHQTRLLSSFYVFFNVICMPAAKSLQSCLILCDPIHGNLIQCKSRVGCIELMK